MSGENRDSKDPQSTVLEESKSGKYYGDKLYAFRGHPDCTMATYTHTRTQKRLQYNVVDMFFDSDKLHYLLRSTQKNSTGDGGNGSKRGKIHGEGKQNQILQGIFSNLSSDCHASDLSSLPPFSLQVSRGRIKRARPASAMPFMARSEHGGGHAGDALQLEAHDTAGAP